MKRSIFWDMTQCSSLKVNRHFGRTYRFHLQCKISGAKHQRENRRCVPLNVGGLSKDYTRFIPEDSTVHWQKLFAECLTVLCSRHYVHLLLSELTVSKITVVPDSRFSQR
jgi:hypothetical protein